MTRLIALFAPRCPEHGTLEELERMLIDENLWPHAHELFGRIRRKTLIAERDGDRRIVAQYLFEEICAKTLYNLSNSKAPFDPDSPYWIVPNALALARQLGVEHARVVEVVVP